MDTYLSPYYLLSAVSFALFLFYKVMRNEVAIIAGNRVKSSLNPMPQATSPTTQEPIIGYIPSKFGSSNFVDRCSQLDRKRQNAHCLWQQNSRPLRFS